MPTSPPGFSPWLPAPDPDGPEEEFDDDAFAWANQLAGKTSEMSAVAANVFANAQEAESAAGAAAASSTTAGGHAASALGHANTAGGHAATAGTQAGIAAAKADESAQLKADMLALLDQFEDKYLGVKAADPTLDNDGNALVAGAFYINSASGFLRAYTGAAWVQGISALAGVESINGLMGAIALKTLAGQALTGAGDLLPVASQAEMEAGTEANLRAMSPQRVAQAIAALASGGLLATGTAAEAVVAGDPLAWRSSDNKLEKIKRVRQTPWTAPAKHLIVTCPHVEGNTRINTSSGGVFTPRYSVYDSTALCVWSEYVLNTASTNTAKVRACAGTLSDDGTISWGSPVDVLPGDGHTTSVNSVFDCVVLSSTLAGVLVNSANPSTSHSYVIINIVGNTITNTSSRGTVVPSSNSNSHYMNQRALTRVSSTKALLVQSSSSSGSSSASGAAVIDFTSTATVWGTNNPNSRTYGDCGAVGNGGLGGRLSVGPAGGGLFLNYVTGSSVTEVQLFGSAMYNGSNAHALGFDGTRYFVAVFTTNPGSTQVVCIDSGAGYAVGSAVSFGLTFYNPLIWYDPDTSTFFVADTSAGKVYPITRSGTTLTIGAAVNGVSPLYGRASPALNMSELSCLTQCGTSKFFAAVGSTSSPTYPAIFLLPYAPSNAENYIGIADAAAAANGTVKYTPHGGVTTKLSGLTPFRETLLSAAGVIGASGILRAGLALSASSLQVHTPQNDFSRIETWTANGTWVCPWYVTKIQLIEVTGGGAGAWTTTAARAQGGESVSGYLDVVPGQSYSIVIGAGGTSSATDSSVTAGGNTSMGSVVAAGGLHDAWSSRSQSQILRNTATPRLYVSSCVVRRKGGVGWQVSTNESYGGNSGAGANDYGRAGGVYYDGSNIPVNGNQGVVIFAY